MTEWRKTIELSQVLSHYDPDEGNFSDVRDRAVAVLRKDPLYEDDEDFSLIVDELADAEDPDQFDWVLDDLYGWADNNLVWMGIP
jgi:hypothetical protein